MNETLPEHGDNPALETGIAKQEVEKALQKLRSLYGDMLKRLAE